MAFCPHDKIESRCVICSPRTIDKLFERIELLESANKDLNDKVVSISDDNKKLKERLDNYLNAKAIVPLEQIKYGENNDKK